MSQVNTSLMVFVVLVFLDSGLLPTEKHCDDYTVTWQTTKSRDVMTAIAVFSTRTGQATSSTKLAYC